MLSQGQPAQYTSRSNAQNHVTLDSTAVLALQLQKSDGGVGCGSKMVARRSSSPSTAPRGSFERRWLAPSAAAAVPVSVVDWRWWRGTALLVFPKRGFERMRPVGASSGVAASDRFEQRQPATAALSSGGSSLNRHGGSYERRFGLGLVLRSFPFLKKNS